MIINTDGIQIDLEINNDEILEALKNAIERGFIAIGETGEGYAKDNILKAKRVDTGRMMNSITYKVTDDAVYIGTNVDYAKDHEIGTSVEKTYRRSNGQIVHAKIYPVHFLQRAVNDHKDEYTDFMVDSIKNA